MVSLRGMVFGETVPLGHKTMETQVRMMINHSTVENHVTKKPQFYWSMCERAANSFTNNLVTAHAINSSLRMMINHSTLDYHVTNFNTLSRWLLRTNQNSNPLL